MEIKKCFKCKINDRISNNVSYCRPCKSKNDLISYHRNSKNRIKYQKEYLENNPEKLEKVRKQSTQWRKDNPTYVTEWMNNKIKTDPSYYIKSRILSSLGMGLKGLGKSEKMIWYLGCTIKEFKIHLENQFVDGMNWDNKGRFGWHIDHIKPMNTFNLENPEELKDCWNYTNLRPLWWFDNIRRPKDGSDINY